MINAAITQLALNLDEALRKTFQLDEKIVVVSNTVEQDGSLPLAANNKVALSLINIERETYSKNASVAGSGFARSPISSQPIYLNLYVMVSICFGGSNYLEAMKFLSNTIAFFSATLYSTTPTPRRWTMASKSWCWISKICPFKI